LAFVRRPNNFNIFFKWVIIEDYIIIFQPMPQRLGQHFLNDKSFLKKIVDALNIEKGDFVVEIGPGHGELTKEIRNQSLESKIITIEKDKRMTNLLKENLKNDKDIEILEGDALKILPTLTENYQLKAKNYKLVGNIPYYITGYLFRIIADSEPKPKTIVFTIQKEVAERIIALRQAQGKPNMNLLAASVQFWVKPEIIGYIPKTAFSPQPKVDSAIIKLTPNDKQETIENKEKYYHLIKILFKQPRKTILNNISAGFEKTLPTGRQVKSKMEEILQKADINPSHRPQNLTINQIIALSTLF